MRLHILGAFLLVPVLSRAGESDPAPISVPISPDSSSDSAKAGPLLVLDAIIREMPRICECIGRRLTIKSSKLFQPKRWSIYSMQGRPIRPPSRMGIETTTSVDLTDLAKGHYLVNIEDNSGRNFSRLIEIK